MVRFKWKDTTRFISKDSILDAKFNREDYSLLLNLRKGQLFVTYENEEQFANVEFLMHAYLMGGEGWIDISPESITASLIT